MCHASSSHHRDQRFRVRDLSNAAHTAEGDTRDQAITNFRTVVRETPIRPVEVITIDISDVVPSDEMTVADSPLWQAAKGILADEDDYAIFMEGVHNRWRELDELEARWQNNS